MQKPEKNPKESEVQASIVSTLLSDPRVVMVNRVNNGAMPTLNGRWVRFNALYLNTDKIFAEFPEWEAEYQNLHTDKEKRDFIKTVDLQVNLADGTLLYIEVKRLRGSKRDAGQDRFLALQERFGNQSLLAHSAQEVLDKLENILPAKKFH